MKYAADDRATCMACDYALNLLDEELRLYADPEDEPPELRRAKKILEAVKRNPALLRQKETRP
jgi:hypothetical protein